MFTLGALVRHDQYNYYPSPDPFNDLGPLQDETVSQLRFLTNAGVRADLVVRQGDSQHQSRSHLRTHIPYRERRVWNCESGLLPGLLPGSDACRECYSGAIRPDDWRAALPLPRAHRRQRDLRSMRRTPSPKGLGPSTLDFAEISTTVSMPFPASRSRVSASPTTSKRPIPCSEFPTPAPWKARSTRT